MRLPGIWRATRKGLPAAPAAIVRGPTDCPTWYLSKYTIQAGQLESESEGEGEGANKRSEMAAAHEAPRREQEDTSDAA